MGKIHNKVFVIFFLLVLCTTLGTKALSYVGVEFPEWTGIDKERSYLEGRDLSNLPSISLEKVLSTEFQDEFEQFIADALPFRETALLANASVQRFAIEIANMPFGYEVYPSYYDSGYVYDPDYDAIFQTLSSATDSDDEAYEAAAAAYNSFAEQHSDINMAFLEVDRMSSSTLNPTNDYVTNPINTEYQEEHFYNLLDDDIAVIDATLDSEEEVATSLFRADHHWDVSYAYSAYERVLNYFLSDEDPVSYEVLTWEEPIFYGSSARSGLCLPDEPDRITDYYVDLSSLEVRLDGAEVDAFELDGAAEYAEGEWASDTFTNRYAEYFHQDYGFIEIRNSDLNNGVSLLIVGDSFSNNMERFFTAHYENVYVYDARHADNSLDYYLDWYDVDDLVFILSSTNYPSESMVEALSE